MSAGSNILWASLGALAGYALASHILETQNEEPDEGGGEGRTPTPEGRFEGEQGPSEVEVSPLIQNWDGEKWMN